MKIINNWFQRHFSDPQVVFLVIFLVLSFTIVLLFNDTLTPVFSAIVIAYLLEGIVAIFSRLIKHRLASVILVFVGFLASLMITLFVITPLLWDQITDLISDTPKYIEQGRQLLLRLPQNYNFISEESITVLISQIQSEVTSMGKTVLTFSLNSIQGSITIMIYLILAPLLVFFFLKDKEKILNWFLHFFPENTQLSTRVWEEMDQQIGNYVRGKFWEITIISAICFTTFTFLGLKYALLISFLVGLSVVVPYIGATLVTIPVALIAFFQWGWTSDFAWLMIAYGIIQALDGNVIVPLLFSEVVNLHPVAIIVAILFFGGLWGFWGIFFAIPLGTLVNSVIRAWPSIPDEEELSVSES
ncbi:MAG: AI-2E family transporter [gamma proteobacterium symbiont of Taylorina sp.]|nr:AI-2E family transporter [gamma proteobacterium symbiont of Taylorina sp.]